MNVCVQFVCAVSGVRVRRRALRPQIQAEQHDEQHHERQHGVQAQDVGPSEMRQAHLAGEQLRDDGDPQGQHEQDVRDAHLVRVGQLVRLTANLVDVKAERKYDGRTAEQHHCAWWEISRFFCFQYQVLQETENAHSLAVKPTQRAYGMTSRSQLLDASRMTVVVTQMQPRKMQIRASSHSGCSSGEKHSCDRLYSVMHVHIRPSRVSPVVVGGLDANQTNCIYWRLVCVCMCVCVCVCDAYLRRR